MTEEKFTLGPSKPVKVEIDYQKLGEAVAAALRPPPTSAEKVQDAKAALSAYTQELNDLASPYGVSVGDLLAELAAEERNETYRGFGVDEERETSEEPATDLAKAMQALSEASR
jgi:hypothetical protein